MGSLKLRESKAFILPVVMISLLCISFITIGYYQRVLDYTLIVRQFKNLGQQNGPVHTSTFKIPFTESAQETLAWCYKQFSSQSPLEHGYLEQEVCSNSTKASFNPWQGMLWSKNFPRLGLTIAYDTEENLYVMHNGFTYKLYEPELIDVHWFYYGGEFLELRAYADKLILFSGANKLWTKKGDYSQAIVAFNNIYALSDDLMLKLAIGNGELLGSIETNGCDKMEVKRQGVQCAAQVFVENSNKTIRVEKLKLKFTKNLHQHT